MPEVGRDGFKRFQCEFSPVEFGMRNGQRSGVDGSFSVKQDVQVDRARSPAGAFFPAQAFFYGFQLSQKFFWGKGSFNLGGGVKKPSLPGADGRGLIKGRN